MGRSTAVLDDIEAVIPRLRRYTRLFVGDPNIADDLVANCLSTAADRLGSLKWGEDLLIWLLSIQQRIILREYDSSTAGAAGIGGGRGNGSDTSLASQALPDAIVSALLHLSLMERALLLLVVVEDLSYGKAAKVVGIAADEVPPLLSKARASIHRIIDADYGNAESEPVQPALP